MAKFTKDCYYILKRDISSSSLYSEIVFYVKEIYKEGNTTRVKGPGLYRFIDDKIYIGIEVDVIPSAYTKQRDDWEIITKKQALKYLFDKVFSDNWKSIRDISYLKIINE